MTLRSYLAEAETGASALEFLFRQDDKDLMDGRERNRNGCVPHLIVGADHDGDLAGLLTPPHRGISAGADAKGAAVTRFES
jgi:hypothetical protein